MKPYQHKPPPLSQDYGPCCGCGAPFGTNAPFMLIRLHMPAPVPWSGWGCAVCQLPPDGALAVICSACFEQAVLPCQAIRGPVGSKARVEIHPLAILILPPEFDHNHLLHLHYHHQLHGLDLDPADREN